MHKHSLLTMAAIAAIALGANSAVAQLACDASSLAAFCISYPNVPSESLIGCGAGDIVGTSCPTANLIGTCTQPASSMSWYTRNGLTSSSASLLSASCALNGGTWSGASVSPITTVSPSTPLPPAPTTQSTFSVTSGTLPSAAVTVSQSGTFGSANLVISLDLSKILSGGSFTSAGRFAASYNIYVAAFLPAGTAGLSESTWFVYPNSRVWAPLSIPIAAYLEGLSESATDTVQIDLLQSLDVTGVAGAEIYIGYGTSSDEMLSAGRYRGVYKLSPNS